MHHLSASLLQPVDKNLCMLFTFAIKGEFQRERESREKTYIHTICIYIFFHSVSLGLISFYEMMITEILHKIWDIERSFWNLYLFTFQAEGIFFFQSHFIHLDSNIQCTKGAVWP